MREDGSFFLIQDETILYEDNDNINPLHEQQAGGDGDGGGRSSLLWWFLQSMFDFHERHRHRHRELAGGGEDPKLYYGALSVAVETIALLLFVEACRRKLDHLAINRPIFLAVLDGVYRELATLGIVELFIHLLHEYYDKLDLAKEAIFVDVHFVFFYTAIFNAFQSTLMAFVAHRVSYNTWVKTEEVELNHYVEIREEFDRVRKKLYGDDDPYYTSSASNHNNPLDYSSSANVVVHSLKAFGDNLQKSTHQFYETGGLSCWDSMKKFCVGIFYTIKYPRLKAKHDALLVQVRFHELRVHFIQSYDLPNKLKVSTYLMRSLQAVLKHLIHISTMAWLWLTGMINVLYYLSGIVVHATEDIDSAGTTMAVCFIIEMVVFILVSLWIYRRMHVIFYQIMEAKHLWDVNAQDDYYNNNKNHHGKNKNTTNNNTNTSANNIHNNSSHNDDAPVDYQDGPLHKSSRFRDPTLASEQLNLFFLGDPKIVITAIQFMQFGYAIALSVVVVFWENMNQGGHFRGVFYLFVTLGCYTIFLIIMAKTLVRFTMATSLGQLVDRKRLHETVAMFRLEEAERRRQQRMEMNVDYYFSPAEAPAGAATGAGTATATGTMSPAATGARTTPLESSKTNAEQVEKPEEAAAALSLVPPEELPPPLIPTLESDTTTNEDTAAGKSPFNGGEGFVLLTAPLTSDLMLRVPGPDSIDPATAAPKPPPPPPTAALALTPLTAIPEKQATMESEKADLLMDLVKMDTTSLRAAVPLDEIRQAERRDRRRNRRKSVSDGVALMSAIGKVGQNVQNVLSTVTPAFIDPDKDKQKATLQAPFGRSQTHDSITREPKATGAVAGPKFAVDDSALNNRRERRRNRKKSVSDGVALMSALANSGDNIFNVTTLAGKETSQGEQQQSTQAPFRRSNTADNVVTRRKPSAVPVKIFAMDDSAATRRKERRQNRKKAVSASSAIQQMRDFTGFGGGGAAAAAAASEEQKEPETFDVWNNRIVSATPENKPSEVTMATTSTPSMFSLASKTAESSTTTSSTARQRRERRKSRQKALSASAAVRLMRDASDEDLQREQQSMMELWKTSKQVPEGDEHSHDETSPSTQNTSIASLQQSELLLSNKSFLASIEEQNADTDKAMLIPLREALSPVREVSATMEDSSRMDFARGGSTHSKDSSTQLEPPLLNMLAASDLSPKSSADTTEPRQNPFRRHGCNTSPGKGPDVDEDDEDDDETIETDRSVGGLSHVGEVSDFSWRHNASFLDDDDDVGRPTLATRLAQVNDKARSFFRSPTYGYVTHLFGTMIIFFLLGMRVESFLKQNCSLPSEDATWELPLETAFWMIFACFIFFLLGASWKIILFPACLDRSEYEQSDGKYPKQMEWMLFIAAIVDLVICLACFLIFIGAEIHRCCDGNEYPTLESYSDKYDYDDHYADDSQSDSKYHYDDDGQAASEGHTFEIINDGNGTGSSESYHEPATEDQFRLLAGVSAYEYEEEPAVCVDYTSYCNCLTFGTRVEGGLGSIEPWSALIVLRMFRFLVADQIVKRLNLGSDEAVKQNDSEAEGGKSQAHLTSHGGHDHGGGHETGTAVELWQAAVSQYPEIVDKYGEFSAELLQAMLGIEITGGHGKPQPAAIALEKPSSPTANEGATGGVATRTIRRSESSYENLATTDHITLEEKRYRKLGEEAQAIIAAGKLGCPVKSCYNLAEMAANRDFSSPSPRALGAPIEFEVDRAQLEIEAIALDSLSAFEFPNARLVRSMRRCQRKLIPLLTRWSEVDVVVTNHEIVYVDVNADEEEGNDDNQRVKEAGRQALVATKGGKGLRLCDVIAGRRVVGHLSFTDILSVYVERLHRLPESVPRSSTEVTAELNHGHVEFWQDPPEKDRSEDPLDRQKRWDCVHQDALKIETTSGCLYLRFFSDLEDSEAHPERVAAESDEASPVYKDIALQWGQTIIRKCSPGQLKQSLPHFCTNDDAELKDFLQIVVREENTRGRRGFASSSVRTPAKSPHHRRSKSRVRRSRHELPVLSSDDEAEPPLSRRQSNEGGNLGQAPPKVPAPRKFTRFASYDDGERHQNADKGEEEDGRAMSIA